MKGARTATRINMNVDGPKWDDLKWDDPDTASDESEPRAFGIMFHPGSLPMLRAILLQLHAEGLAWSSDTSGEGPLPPR